MELGIFARTFPRPTLEGSLDAVAGHGLRAIQFNFSVAGLPTLPERIDERLCASISGACRERGLAISALSGTFNLIAHQATFDPERLRRSELSAETVDPDGSARESSGEAMFDRLERMAAACRHLDTRIITLCTGTCDPDDMWKWHPDNVRRGAWKLLIASMKRVARIADRHEVTMAIEPELGNVINTTAKARMLLDELGSPWFKIVIDPANLFWPGDLPRMREFLDEAFEWLGPDICLAHAKELSPEGGFGGMAPGRGVVDWDHYLHWLGRVGYRGPLIIHGLPESVVAEAIRFLRSRMEPKSDMN